MILEEAQKLWLRAKYRAVRVACQRDPMLYISVKEWLGKTPFFEPDVAPVGFVNTHKARLMSKMTITDTELKPRLQAQLEGLNT
jgi:hypothetical protein